MGPFSKTPARIYGDEIYFVIIITNSCFFFKMFVFVAGYGYITPQTLAGQILCIFVSLLGIPITLLALKSIGELVAKSINNIVKRFEKKVLKRSEPKHVKPKSAMILFTLLFLFIVINRLAITEHRDWSIIEGVYFWFITFTTIGFGDYVLNKSKRIRKISVSMFTNKSISQENEHASGGDLSGRHIFFLIYFILCLCIVSSALNSIMAIIAERKYRRRFPGCAPRKTKHNMYNKKGENQNVREPVVMTHFRIGNVQFQKENTEKPR